MVGTLLIDYPDPTAYQTSKKANKEVASKDVVFKVLEGTDVNNAEPNENAI